MSDARKGRFKVVVIGISTGGVGALKSLLGALPPDFPLPILIVQHLAREAGSGMAALLDELCALTVKEADEQEVPQPGTAYLAPPNYHLLVEPDGRLGLSIDQPVAFARPSADVLFESAAESLGEGVIGVVLTGAGSDGSQGLQRIKENGGLTVVQDPEDAAASSMPKHAIMAVMPDHVVTLAELPHLLLQLCQAGDR